VYGKEGRNAWREGIRTETFQEKGLGLEKGGTRSSLPILLIEIGYNRGKSSCRIRGETKRGILGNGEHICF